MKFIPPTRHHDTPHDPDFFVIKDAAGAAALRHWLKPRVYNTATHFIDRNGSFCISLIFDFEALARHSTKRHRRGIICIADQRFEQSTHAVVMAHRQGILRGYEDARLASIIARRMTQWRARQKALTISPAPPSANRRPLLTLPRKNA